MKVINLCRKPIVIVTGAGSDIVLPASPQPARVRSTRTRVVEKIEVNGTVAEIEIVYSETLGAANVPPEEEGIFYVVPVAVASALQNRRDLLTTGLLSRDDRGEIISAQALVSNRYRSSENHL